jgi:hypothetical protein
MPTKLICSRPDQLGRPLGARVVKKLERALGATSCEFSCWQQDQTSDEAFVKRVRFPGPRR